MKILVRGLLLLGLVGVFFLGQVKGDELRVVFCDVGQGDAILIQKGEVEVLIDGGVDGDRVMRCLSDQLPFWDRELEVMVNTHPDRDHVGGLPRVMSNYQVDQLIISEWGENRASEELKRLSEEKEVPVHEAAEGEVIALDELKLRVLWPVRDDSGQVLGVSDKTNERGVVLKLIYGEFEVLLTGDIGEVVEKELVLDEIEVLKVAHHGSKYSSSEEFLKAVSPELSVIEVGKNNYGHPTSEALERLQATGTRILRTDEEGDIVVLSDGRRWWVE